MAALPKLSAARTPRIAPRIKPPFRDLNPSSLDQVGTTIGRLTERCAMNVPAGSTQSCCRKTQNSVRRTSVGLSLAAGRHRPRAIADDGERRPEVRVRPLLALLQRRRGALQGLR